MSQKVYEEEIFPFVQYLLDKGATIFKHDNHGKTAMNYAKENGLEKVYKLLKDTAKALQRERMQEVFGFWIPENLLEPRGSL